MRKKALNVLLFVAVVIAAVGMTLVCGTVELPGSSGLQLLLSWELWQ